MNIRYFENEMSKEFDTYEVKIHRIAEIAFNDTIKPYLVKHNYKFLSGNGTWYIYCFDKNKKEIEIDVDKLPNRIKDLLNLEIPGYRSNGFGDFMPNYT